SWLDINDHDAAARLTEGANSIQLVCEELSAKHLLSEILIRNRKKVVGGFMPRQAHRWEVALSERERAALAAVEDYVREGYARAARTNDSAAGFVMVIFQKLMASSIRALRTSLDRRRLRLEASASAPSLRRKTKLQLSEIEDRLDDDELVSNVLEEIAAAE